MTVRSLWGLAPRTCSIPTNVARVDSPTIQSGCRGRARGIRRALVTRGQNWYWTALRAASHGRTCSAMHREVHRVLRVAVVGLGVGEVGDQHGVRRCRRRARRPRRPRARSCRRRPAQPAQGLHGRLSAARASALGGPGEDARHDGSWAAPFQAPRHRSAHRVRLPAGSTAGHRLVRVRRMGRSLRIALLSYRSKPHSGGQGIYVRALSRELTELGHRVRGPQRPALSRARRRASPLTRLPSLDLYREPDPFRTPRPSEFRDWIDVAEWATMCTAGFPEPMTFSLRAARQLLPRAGRVRRRPRQPVPGLGAAAAGPGRRADRGHRPPPDRHRPAARAGRDPVAAPPADPAPLVRLHRHAGPGRRAGSTPSPPCRRARGATSPTHMGLPAERHRGHPGRHRPRRVHPAAGRPAPRPRLDPGHHQRRRRRSRAWCTCSRRWPSCAPSGRCG